MLGTMLTHSSHPHFEAKSLLVAAMQRLSVVVRLAAVVLSSILISHPPAEPV
jgi:hypothetical protein